MSNGSLENGTSGGATVLVHAVLERLTGTASPHQAHLVTNDRIYVNRASAACSAYSELFDQVSIEIGPALTRLGRSPELTTRLRFCGLRAEIESHAPRIGATARKRIPSLVNGLEPWALREIILMIMTLRERKFRNNGIVGLLRAR